MTDPEGERLAALTATIRTLEARYGRAPGAVSLLAVSKRQSVAAMRRLCAAGQRAFGENYVQEALGKQAELHDLALDWHFIGPIQGNKTAEIAANFSWVHSLDRMRIAERLNRQRPAELPPLNVMIEVNISGEATKHGVARDELGALIEGVRRLPRLALRGLMTLPEPTPDVARQRAAFAALAALARNAVPPLEELSMGTSDDYPAAIAEGATWVRLGTLLFGPRR